LLESWGTGRCLLVLVPLAQSRLRPLRRLVERGLRALVVRPSPSRVATASAPDASCQYRLVIRRGNILLASVAAIKNPIIIGVQVLSESVSISFAVTRIKK
jgi:hypothetical protein